MRYQMSKYLSMATGTLRVGRHAGAHPFILLAIQPAQE